MWHGISVLINLGTLVLATVALGLAVKLPDAGRRICGCIGQT